MKYNSNDNYNKENISQENLSPEDKGDIKLVRIFLSYELTASYELNSLIQVIYNKEVKKILYGMMKEHEKHFKLWGYFLRSLDSQQARAYELSINQIPDLPDDDRTISRNEVNGDLYTVLGEEINNAFELINLYEDNTNSFKGSKKNQGIALILEVLPIEMLHVEKMIRILNILKIKDAKIPRYRLPQYNTLD